MKLEQETQTSVKAEATRRGILTAALALFQEKGFQQATMRDIAASAGLSVGAAYYYFRGKDELVLAFYEQTGEESRQYNASIVAAGTDFRKRFESLLKFKFQQLQNYRSFIGVLAASAANPNSPLSPFSPETKKIRDEAITLIADVIEGSNIKVAKLIRPQLPRLLWLYQMALIFYWINDSSPNQKRSEELLEQSLGIILALTKISSLPLMAPVNRSAMKLVSFFDEPLEVNAAGG